MNMNSPSLREIERRAYRSTFADGIYDIQFGLIFLVFAIMPILPQIGISRFAGYAFLLIPLTIPLLGKRFITVPRMGAVIFGPERQTRKRLNLIIAAILLVLTVPLIVLIATRKIPGTFGWELLAIFAAPVVLVAVYMVDFPRFFIYLAVMIFSILAAEFLSKPTGFPLGAIISFGLPGLVITVIGVILLVKFLKTYHREADESAEK